MTRCYSRVRLDFDGFEQVGRQPEEDPGIWSYQAVQGWHGDC